MSGLKVPIIVVIIGEGASGGALGIGVGDFVAFDPRVEMSNGFIRSRFLDDKACVACALATAKALFDAGLQPKQKTYLYFTAHEEVGHGGAAGIPADTAELLVTDMAAIGDGQTSDEFNVTICVKDSGGPYHHGLSQHLRNLADKNNIPYKVDIYPYYGSDGMLMHDTYGDSPRLIPETAMKEYDIPDQTIPRSIGIYDEWLQAIKDATKSTTDFEYSAKLTEMMLLGNIAIKLKDKNTILEYDGKKGEFTNMDEANELLTKKYSKGFEM